MLKSFFATPDRALYAWLMLAWLLFIGWYNVQILVYYNAWNREFYDAIQTLQEERFSDKLIILLDLKEEYGRLYLLQNQESK